MVDLLGLGIFVVGIALIVFELTVPGYFIGVGGTVAVIVGLVQMAWPDFLFSWWSPFLVTIIAAVSTYASVQFYKKFAPPARAPETLSSDALVGREGKVVDAVEPTSTKGKVKLGSIVWSAESIGETIEPGAVVVVERVEGVHLVVRRPVESATSQAATPQQ